MFKQWLSSKYQGTSCSFQDLELTKINNIIAHLLLDKQLIATVNVMNTETFIADKFMENIAQQTISVAETIVQHYMQTVIDEKKRIFDNGEKFKKPPSVVTITDAIEYRQMNMVQRAQYNIEQHKKSFFIKNVS